MIKGASSLAELLHVFENLVFDLWRQEVELLRVYVYGIGIFINLILERQTECYNHQARTSDHLILNSTFSTFRTAFQYTIYCVYGYINKNAILTLEEA